jgi:hypothetical protein
MTPVADEVLELRILIYALRLLYLFNSLLRRRISTLLLFLVIFPEVSTGTDIYVSVAGFFPFSLVTDLPALQFILLLQITALLA